MKKKNGITLIALIITIIVLLILAGVTISLVVGDNGILQKSTTAKLTMEVEQEKELIGISYSAVKARKLAQGDTSSIRGAELDIQLQDDGAGARASGDNPIIVTFEKTGRTYKIDGNGKVVEIGGTTSGTEDLSLTYELNSSVLKVFPKSKEYDEISKEYYETLEEYFVGSANYWLIHGGVIPEGTVLNSFSEVMPYMFQEGLIDKEYQSFKEYYQADAGNGNCATWLMDMECLGYVDYLEVAEAYNNDYYSYAEEIYNQVQALLPNEYYISVTLNEETRRIDLNETSYAYAEFSAPNGGDYLIYGINEQNSSESNIIAHVPQYKEDIGGRAYGDTIWVDDNMTWREFVDSPYGKEYKIVGFSVGDYEYREYVGRYFKYNGNRFYMIKNVDYVLPTDYIDINGAGYEIEASLTINTSGLTELNEKIWLDLFADDNDSFRNFINCWNCTIDGNFVYVSGNGIEPVPIRNSRMAVYRNDVFHIGNLYYFHVEIPQ